MTMANSYSGGVPMVGTEVFTADGDTLGTVKEVTGTCFKVDAKMQPDYWLATDTIASADGGAVRLSLNKDRVGQAKVDGPEHHGIHRHNGGSTVL